MIHKALQLVGRGDVIVIDGGGDVSQALIGGNIQTTAIFHGSGRVRHRRSCA
jgi:regulator of RNase E activity RraA